MSENDITEVEHVRIYSKALDALRELCAVSPLAEPQRGEVEQIVKHALLALTGQRDPCTDRPFCDPERLHSMWKIMHGDRRRRRDPYSHVRPSDRTLAPMAQGAGAALLPWLSTRTLATGSYANCDGTEGTLP
jgi:hypothetical protein